MQGRVATEKSESLVHFWTPAASVVPGDEGRFWPMDGRMGGQPYFGKPMLGIEYSEVGREPDTSHGPGQICSDFSGSRGRKGFAVMKL